MATLVPNPDRRWSGRGRRPCAPTADLPLPPGLDDQSPIIPALAHQPWYRRMACALPPNRSKRHPGHRHHLTKPLFSSLSGTARHGRGPGQHPSVSVPARTSSEAPAITRVTAIPSQSRGSSPIPARAVRVSSPLRARRHAEPTAVRSVAPKAPASASDAFSTHAPTRREHLPTAIVRAPLAVPSIPSPAHWERVGAQRRGEGYAAGSFGSVPAATSSPSPTPSPSVSTTSGSEVTPPGPISSPSVRPSPSVSGVFGSVPS